MEGRRRRSFTDDYKRQAVDLVASSGRSIGSVAKELGLRDSVLRRWVEQRGALSVRHRFDRAGGGLLQRPRIRGAPWHWLRFGAAGDRRAALPRPGGTAGGTGGGALHASAVAYPGY